MLRQIAVFLVMGAGLAAAAVAAPLELARIQGGQVQGVIAGDVVSFKGIPFAAPPVGALRWRAPQPVVPWRGVRPAKQFGNACLQSPSRNAGEHDLGAPIGEDCLYLNVWRPAQARGALPVMVWIYGGALVRGAACCWSRSAIASGTPGFLRIRR